MSKISQPLLWELTKDRSCFLRKRGHVTFSYDPYNINYKNTRRSSGFVKKHAVNVRIVKRRPNILVKSTNAKGVVNKIHRATNAKQVKEFLDKSTKLGKVKKGKILRKYNRLLRLFKNTPKKMKDKSPMQM